MNRPPPQASQSGADAGEASRAEPDCKGLFTARDAEHRRRTNRWMLGAALAYLVASAALRWRESIPRPLPWICVGLALVLAVLAIRSYRIFLRGADELLRKIQTEALGLGFASGAVFSILYPLLEGLGAPEVGANATALVMMLAWGAGSWLGTRRYSAAVSV